jgi:predicted HicB family RNase H-like nuclease
MSLKNDHYTYRVIWSEEDQEHVALCAEFPSLSWLSTTPEKALKGMRGIVASSVEDLIQNNEPIPESLSEKNFSGKFMVRIPPVNHRELAAEAGISINRLVSSLLSKA